MGQTQQFTTSSVAQIKPTTDYEIDRRIVTFPGDDSSSIAQSSQKMVDQVTQIANLIAEHSFEKYMINGLDKHFYCHNTLLGKEEFSQKRLTTKSDPKKQQSQQWFELSTKQQFLKIFTSLKQHYHIEKILQQLYWDASALFKDGFAINQQMKKASLCRHISGAVPQSQISLDEALIVRLFFSYYMKILKRNGTYASKVASFHQNTGYRLCLLISSEQIKLQQLFQLLYCMVYIDKHQISSDKKLNLIHQRYNQLCLTKYYSTNINKRKYQIMRTAARLYLDQLYMTSIKQAEDPDIVAQNDCLLPTRTFPIQKVKTKNKNV